MKIAVLFGAVGIVIGILATALFTNLFPPSILDTKDCTRENDCIITPINGTYYQLRGESYKAYENCSATAQECTWITIKGTHYLLEGEAHQAYVIMDNIASQLHMMKFDSQFVDERGYLINIEGHNLPAVERLVEQYNISESLVDVHPTNKNWKSVYGLIFKEDLIRFVEENDAQSIASESLTVSRVGSVSNGETTISNPFIYPAGEAEQAIVELEQFKEQEIQKIVLQKQGVTRINDSDLTKVDDYSAGG